MKKTLKKLLDKENLTQKELEQVEEDEDVITLQVLGASGLHVGLIWFDVTLKNDNRYDVYCKY